MGRRSRKRAPAGVRRDPTPVAAPPPPPPRPAAPPARSRPRREDAPPAPWHPFPLVELTVLVGLVLIVWGFVGGGSRRELMLGCGFALASLAGLELSVREHLTGHRSHTTVLAGAAAVLVDLPLYFLTDVARPVLLAVGVAVFAGAFAGLRAVFRRRTGGVAFRA